MKKLEVTVPEDTKDEVIEVLEEYTEDFTSSEVDKDGDEFKQFSFVLDSEKIDNLTEDIKGIKNLESGDLTIEVLEETARIEKGKRHEGGSSLLSVQEMYTKAFEFSSFNKISWALIALAAGIAVFGVNMGNVMVVIGAMVIAPILSPLISASFGLVVGDKKLIQDSFLYGFLSILVAISSAFLIAIPLPKNINSLMLLIATPRFATILLSLFVGAASALTYTTETREDIAGVAVAIALVPPASVAGMSLAMMSVEIFFDVMIVLLTNVTALILAGTLTFKLVGVQPTTYYRKKVSEKSMRKALFIAFTFIVSIALVVGYFSFQEYQMSNTRNEVNQLLEEEFGRRLLRKDVDVTRDEIKVDLAAVDPKCGTRTLEKMIEEKTRSNATVEMLAVEGMK